MKTIIALLALSSILFCCSSSSYAIPLDAADQALDSFLANYWNPHENYLNDHFSADGSVIKKITQYWTYVMGFDALLDGASRNFTRYGSWINKFYEGQAKRGWNREYYDDLNWMGLALTRAHHLTNNKTFIEQATSLFKIIQAAWDTSCCGGEETRRGGIWWDIKHTQKATASNAGPVILALKLFEYSKDLSLVKFATRVYDFWFQEMVNHTGTYQVCDHLSGNAKEIQYTWWKFTYNEGLMIGASVNLYQVTGNKTYLENAHKFAQFMLKFESAPSINNSRILYDGSNSQCDGDCQEFKGIGYRYLTLLNKVDAKSEYTMFLRDNVEAIWKLARNEKYNIFSTDWNGPAPKSEATQAMSNSATMALNIYVNSVLQI